MGLLPRPAPSPSTRRASGPPRPSYAAALLALAVLGTLGGCASSPGSTDQGEPVFENPATCPASSTAEPVAAVDLPPNPRGIVIPPVQTAEETEIRLVVGADGRVDPATVVVPGVTDRRVLGEIRSAVSRWTFTPARRGPCWVASEYRYTLRSRVP